MRELGWAVQLKNLAGVIRHTGHRALNRDAAAEAWTILYFALSLYLRLHGSRSGSISREEIEDLAAEKSLDLLEKIVVGSVDFTSRNPQEVAGFISKSARNAMYDHFRSTRRQALSLDCEQDELDGHDWRVAETVGQAESPDAGVESKEFAAALWRCIQQLKVKSRRIWFFRVFYEMSSAMIACHPDVEMNRSHVDVDFHRSKQALAACMGNQGYQAYDIPHGTFVELWKRFRQKEVSAAAR